MTLLSITDEKLRIFVRELFSKRVLFAPVKRNGYFEFSRLSNPEDIILNYTNTRLSPKRLFLPQRQLLFKYYPKKGVTQESEEHSNAVLFGVRPCDASALSVLDSILLKLPYKDNFYENRRRETIVISLSCIKPMAECFCNVFETGPIRGTGEDLTLTPVNKVFIVEVRTPRGMMIVEDFGKLFTEAGREILEEYKILIREAVNEMDRRLRIDKKKLIGLEKEIGEEFFQLNAQRCIECSICSFTCPVCYCFETEDFLEGDHYSRFRGWDTCVHPLFTKMASGLDPRSTKADRIYHRFCHKLSRIPLAFNTYGCVGCGRCVSLCPTGIDIKEVLEKWG
ncbi:MAG: 4Fe-4S dicluster domain-containing protein [Crenarchaeota archaeon]|nr:4Fe-4S dicluster domain-containing protein [Thermoproteota archaeon]MDW8033868.1 4Fe-4S dicluster domain-containing protein [Nitrososphaerota archaeon]